MGMAREGVRSRKQKFSYEQIYQDLLCEMKVTSGSNRFIPLKTETRFTSQTGNAVDVVVRRNRPQGRVVVQGDDKRVLKAAPRSFTHVRRLDVSRLKFQ